MSFVIYEYYIRGGYINTRLLKNLTSERIIIRFTFFYPASRVMPVAFIYAASFFLAKKNLIVGASDIRGNDSAGNGFHGLGTAFQRLLDTFFSWQLRVNLLEGGDTTRNLLSTGVLALQQNPEQRAWLM